MEIPVSRKAVEHGLKLGVKVYYDKLGFPDKFHIGGASELQADIYGFVAETVVCEFFKHSLPKFLSNQLDEFDLKIKGLKVDVKKVSYSRYNKKAKITLNKRQYNRKKNKIDVFLFCTFTGAFQQYKTGVGDHQIFLPIPEIGKLDLLGWIFSLDVEKKGSVYVWRDEDGNPKDESWQLLEKDLKNIKELLPSEDD